MEIPRYWRTQQQRYNLVGEKCPNLECQTLIFPPRDICPNCGGVAKIDPKTKHGFVYERDIKSSNIPQQSQVEV